MSLPMWFKGSLPDDTPVEVQASRARDGSILLHKIEDRGVDMIPFLSVSAYCHVRDQAETALEVG